MFNKSRFRNLDKMDVWGQFQNLVEVDDELEIVGVFVNDKKQKLCWLRDWAESDEGSLGSISSDEDFSD